MEGVGSQWVTGNKVVLAAAMKAYSTERSLGVRTYRLSPGDIRYLSLKLHKGGLDLSLAAVHNDNGGPYYHVFGTRYFEMVVASDWGPTRCLIVIAAAGGMFASGTVAVGGMFASALRVLGA